MRFSLIVTVGTIFLLGGCQLSSDSQTSTIQPRPIVPLYPNASAPLQTGATQSGGMAASTGMAVTSQTGSQFATGSKAVSVNSISTGEIITLGSSSAPIAIVLITEHECSYCEQFHTQLMPEFNVRIAASQARLQLMPLVLEKYPFSERRALALLCATEQQKGVELHHQLFNVTSEETLQNALSQEEINVPQWSACMENEATKNLLAHQQSILKNLAITVVPTYFINGQKYTGLPTLAELRGQIQLAVDNLK